MSSQKHSFIIDGEHQSMHGNSRIYIYIYAVQNSLNKSFRRILYSLNFSGPA
jgi:hypothetical protein